MSDETLAINMTKILRVLLGLEIYFNCIKRSDHGSVWEWTSCISVTNTTENFLWKKATKHHEIW